MNKNDLKNQFNEYYWLAMDIAEDHAEADLADVLKITEILTHISYLSETLKDKGMVNK